MGAKRRKKRGIKQKAVLSKFMERTAQNRVIFGADTKKKKSSKPAWLLDFCGGDGGIRTHVALITPKRFRVFYSQHTLADFEKKCPILRVNALVRKKVLSSPLRLLPTARNARELSERTNRISIKHNSRKSP